MSMKKKSQFDDSTNRSNIKLLNEQEDQKEETKNNEVEEKIMISQYISEVSANDYGYFTLKINEERDENINMKGSQVKKGLLGIINKAIIRTQELSLKKNNFIDLLNKDSYDKITGNKFKLVKNDFELLINLSRDENDYKNFKMINPNEEIYKKLVIFI